MNRHPLTYFIRSTALALRKPIRHHAAVNYAVINYAAITHCAALVLVMAAVSSCDLLRSDPTVPTETQQELARFSDADFVVENLEYLEAIQLAFWLEGGLEADPVTALKFLRQREAIRHRYGDTYPETLRHFVQPFSPGRVIAGIDTSYAALARNPQSGYYETLDERIRPDSVSVHMSDASLSYSWMSAHFSMLYNPEAAVAAYAELPGMVYAETSGLVTIGGNPFPVYPGIIDGDFYYIIRKVATIPLRTSIFRVRQESDGLYRAELVASRSTGDDPWDDRFQEIINEVHRLFRERYYQNIGDD